MLENALGFALENVANVSKRKLGVGSGGGGGGHTEFSRQRRQVFPMQSGCSGGVGQCLMSARLRDYSGQAFFLFWGWSLLDRGRKKKKSGADEDTVICSTFSFRTICCLFRIIET